MFGKKADDKKEMESKTIHVSGAGLTLGWNIFAIILFFVLGLYVTNQLSPIKDNLEQQRKEMNKQELEIHDLIEYNQVKDIERAKRITGFQGRIRLLEERLTNITKVVIEEGCLSQKSKKREQYLKYYLENRGVRC